MQIHVARSSLAAVWRKFWKCTQLGSGRQFGAIKIREASDHGKEERAKLTVENKDGWMVRLGELREERRKA